MLGCCIKANVTVTFIGIKQGLVTGQARNHVGELVFAGLGVQQEFEQTETASASWEFPSIIAKLNQREACVHKGSLGKALVVGGDYGMGGAILIASRACLKAGAGLTACLTDERNISPGLVVSPEVMFAPWSTQRLIERLQWSSAVALGPGLGQSAHAEELFELVSRSSLPKVFDADALNLLTTKPSVDPNRIITPHPGEAARLLNCSINDVENNRYQAARDLSKKYGGVAILKGSGTVIDDGQHRYVCAAGNAGMATGGMGDALTGIIVALLAQGFTLSEAARMGVMLHSYAADLNVKQQGIVGLSAMDVVNTLRKALSVTANDHSSPVT
ncbi:NAD(P)HX epimerase [Vibrio ponticus]|nr:NAD(P)HX epimerase [Vibrio ponticus]